MLCHLQNLKFKKPVYICATCTAKVTMAEIINEEKGICKPFTSVENQDGENVIDGYAIVKYEPEIEYVLT